MSAVTVTTEQAEQQVAVAEAEVAHAEARVAEAEAHAEAAVEIAATEAAAAVEIAAVHAETDKAAIAAAERAATAVTREELEVCQANIVSLTSQMQETNSVLRSIQKTLTPPEPQPETNPSGDAASDPTQASSGAPEPERKKPPFRWI